MMLSCIFSEDMLLLSLCSLTHISLNNFQTLAGLLLFSFKISEY